MTEKLPNWNLGDFYSSIKDEGIDLDLEKYRNFSKSFNKKYKGQLVNQTQNLESIITVSYTHLTLPTSVTV